MRCHRRHQEAADEADELGARGGFDRYGKTTKRDVEEALYESHSMREFVDIDLGQERAPDETTVCKFRHLLERHDLGRQIFEQVGAHVQAQGFRLSTGTIVTPRSLPRPVPPATPRGRETPR